MANGCFYCGKSELSRVKATEQLALYRCVEPRSQQHGKVVAMNKPEFPAGHILDHISNCPYFRGWFSE